MRMNEDTIICGDKVILVPYRPEHVETYHEWMKSPELLEQTASEPLSFEEELEMQKKWQADEDKLTFILLARPPELQSKRLLAPEDLVECPMVGDVNLFAPNGPSEDVECEIMIAEPDYRGHGLAKEALTLFLTYVVHSHLKVVPTHFIARIGSSNESSIRLFERLGFGKVRVVEVWDEVEMRWGWKGTEPARGTKDDWPVERLRGCVGTYAISK